MRNLRFPFLAGTLLIMAGALFAQGDLTPPAGPEPTMKSLQELWDKVDSLEATAIKQQTQLQQIQSQNSMLQRQLTLLSIATVNFAWITTTLDSVGQVGDYNSIAFGPDGYPAVAFYDETNKDLKITRFNGGTWTQTLVDTAGDVGSYCSLVFGPDGQPAISYYGNSNLKFARFDGIEWSAITVDNTSQFKRPIFLPGLRPGRTAGHFLLQPQRFGPEVCAVRRHKLGADYGRRSQFGGLFYLTRFRTGWTTCYRLFGYRELPGEICPPVRLSVVFSPSRPGQQFPPEHFTGFRTRRPTRHFLPSQLARYSPYAGTIQWHSMDPIYRRRQCRCYQHLAEVRTRRPAGNRLWDGHVHGRI
jgi:hypothetical protein